MADLMNSSPATQQAPNRREAHRRVCVLAGGLSIVGAALAFAVHPWFAAVAAAGGIWLIAASDPREC